MAKYIDADRLKAEIEGIRWFPQISSGYNDGREDMKIMVLDIITSLQQEQENVAEQFAKIVRANLSEIGKDAQSQFEQLYFEITGTKMYKGYND